MKKRIIYKQDSEIKLYLDLIEYVFNNIKEQIDDFRNCFEIDDIEKNIIYTYNVKFNIKGMMSDITILTRALRDKLENP